MINLGKQIEQRILNEQKVKAKLKLNTVVRIFNEQKVKVNIVVNAADNFEWAKRKKQK